MNTQKEFNEYIDEKVKSISNLFGTKVVRNETSIEDEYNYIHPYKKSITPFTAEVSANEFASAENNPLEYVVKNFYPNKELYPEQIQKLHYLIEELETLKEAKKIIENYKKDIQQYLANVPSFVMENDEDGFYSRLGFATISEKVLTVNYKFSYTSNSGKAQRSFTVPMTEETIVELVKILEGKLTMASFAKEQRALMTSKLRQLILERDNYTCKYCDNSALKEPNLLLEIDHIIPVSKGGCTVEDNLQTLCWKCNRQKGSKLNFNS
ncbi:MAG: HNH endonuclease [Lachnospiraceae bacterium]|nr:HNH endonuclease [Lachnospiraceae bacterium]